MKDIVEDLIRKGVVKGAVPQEDVPLIWYNDGSAIVHMIDREVLDDLLYNAFLVTKKSEHRTSLLLAGSILDILMPSNAYFDIKQQVYDVLKDTLAEYDLPASIIDDLVKLTPTLLNSKNRSYIDVSNACRTIQDIRNITECDNMVVDTYQLCVLFVALLFTITKPTTTFLYDVRRITGYAGVTNYGCNRDVDKKLMRDILRLSVELCR